MALGRKIEPPVAKKPDPIAAFERGDHQPDGTKAVPPITFGIDYGLGDDTHIALLKTLAHLDRQLLEQMIPYKTERKAVAAPALGLPYGKKLVRDHVMKALVETMALLPNPPLVVPTETARELGLKVEQSVDFQREVVTVKAEADPVRELYARSINREYDEPWAKLFPPAVAVDEGAERQRFANRFGELRRQAKAMGRDITSREICRELGLPYAKLSLDDLRRVLAFMEDRVKPTGYGSAGSFA